MKLPQAVIDSIGEDAIYAKKIVFDLSFNNPFNDIPDTGWFTIPSLWCDYFNYMNGTSATTFEPKTNVSRAMFVTILSRTEGADVSSYTGTSFTDVAEGKWYSKYIEWAYKNDFSAGMGDGTFGTNLNVTRERLAVFLCNYTAKKGGNTSTTINLDKYTDKDKISSWAYDSMVWAVENGLISGKSETTLAPKDPASRAEIAVIVRNYVRTFQSID